MNRREFSKVFIAGGIGSPFLGTAIGPSRAAGAMLTISQLEVSSRTIDIDGRAAKVFGLMQPDGTHGLRLNPGDNFDVNLANGTNEDTLVHWHGLTPPWPMDGVPDLPMPLLKAGEQRQYNFLLDRPGTYWMHAHTLQEQALLAAPLIIRNKDDLVRDEQEAVVLLHDFSFTPAEELLANLKSGSGMGNMKSGMKMQGMDHSKMQGMKMGGGMMGMDINDIEYDAYLANDRTLNDPEIVQVEKGGRVRLRIINGATATAFTIDTGALDGEVIAVDGQDIVPLRTRQFPLAMGQRVDFRLPLPKDGGAFPIFALREGAPQRAGIILASPRAAVSKLPDTSEAEGAILSLDVEARLMAAQPLATKDAARSFGVNLLGSMRGYEWGLEASAALKVLQGERVIVEMRNHTMMSHPMHLHGHHFQIIGINGQAISGAVRDTVFVPPMTRVAFAFDAVNPGEAWAFHCHHLYHMASGMMTTIGYEGG